MVTEREMSTSFGRAADLYEQGRPDYPPQAVAWLLEPVRRLEHAVRTADIGAGTGKLTRALVDAGAETVAVDPDAAMLATLRGKVAGVPTFVGTAERLPLPDAALDAVVLGQAWHWVDHVAASREIGRVLRAGGVLGAVWNIRDESVPWIVRLTEIMHGSNAERMMRAGDPPLSAPFAAWESRTWTWARPVDRAVLTAMVHSRSYLITADDAERARVDAEIGDLFDQIGAVGDAVIDLPYVTKAFRTTKGES